MIFVFTNCNKDDYDILSSHLFKRQIVLFFEDGAFRVGVELLSTSDLTFVASILNCDLLLRPFAYQYDDKRYNVLTIVRGEDEDKNSGDRVQSE